MTLVAFANHGTHVDIATDTGGWDLMQRDGMSHVTKYSHLAHLDAVMLKQGDGQVGKVARYVLDLITERDTFDDLIEAAPGAFQRAGAGDDGAVGTVFLLGWSDHAEAFATYVLASEQNFRAHKVDRWIMPAPWSMRPSGLELRRLKAVAAHTDWGPEAAEVWPTRPPMRAPANDEEWIELANLARDERTMLGPRARVHVTGELWLSRLERGAFASRRVHQWNDTGENLRRMVTGSHHPFAQAEPCVCGSGRRWRDCCLAAWNASNGSCLCGSGQPFEDCCRVDDESVGAGI